MDNDIILVDAEIVPDKRWHRPSKKAKCGEPRAENGQPCQNRAGLRTTHIGRGPCWLHETNPLAIVPKKDAIKFMDVAFQSRVKELMADDDLLNLRRDIAIARALLERIEANSEWIPEDKPKIEYYDRLLNTIGKLVERYERIERERHGLVKVQVVLAVRDAFIDAVMSIISDPNTRMMIYDRLNTDLKKRLPAAMKGPV